MFDDLVGRELIVGISPGLEVEVPEVASVCHNALAGVVRLECVDGTDVFLVIEEVSFLYVLPRAEGLDAVEGSFLSNCGGACCAG